MYGALEPLGAHHAGMLFVLECHQQLPASVPAEQELIRQLSRQILNAYPEAELIVVTSDFHVARARFLFEREFPERRITVSESVTKQPPEVLARLKAHEQNALKKLKNKKEI